MIARGPAPREGGGSAERALKRIHDLEAAAARVRAKRPKRRVGRGIGGKGGKTAGRGSKGQGARGTVPAGLRRWSDAAAPPHAEGQGLQQPVPHRVPRREPVDARRVRRGRRGQPGHAAAPRPGRQAGPGEGAGPRASCRSPSPCRRTASRRRRSGRSRPRAERPRCCRCPGRPGVRRREGTPSPTASYTAVPVVRRSVDPR